MLPQRSKDHLIKPQYQLEKLYFISLMRVIQKTQKILLDISIALGCPTEMEASIYYSENHALSQGSEVHKIELM